MYFRDIVSVVVVGVLKDFLIQTNTEVANTIDLIGTDI